MDLHIILLEEELRAIIIPFLLVRSAFINISNWGFKPPLAWTITLSCIMVVFLTPVTLYARSSYVKPTNEDKSKAFRQVVKKSSLNPSYRGGYVYQVCNTKWSIVPQNPNNRFKWYITIFIFFMRRRKNQLQKKWNILLKPKLTRGIENTELQNSIIHI